MAFPYKHVVMIGATSGIGKAMADRLIKAGVKVTAVGRRQDRLDDFVTSHGETNASSEAFDISNLDEIPQFAAKVTKAHPDIDCIYLNAGIQRPYDFSKPETVDLKGFFAECNVNFNSMVALTHAFLPFLQSKKKAGLLYTGTNLAIVPASWVPAYSASKTALNVFVICLRDQLRASNVKVVELQIPAIQSELHDYMGEEAGRKVGMPIDVFTEEAYAGLLTGKDLVSIGSIGEPGVFNDIVEKRMSLFNLLAKMMRGGS